MTARTVLHPLTLASIEMQVMIPTLCRPGLFSCGCEQRGAGWWLCGYHEGYDDALDVSLYGVPDSEDADEDSMDLAARLRTTVDTERIATHSEECWQRHRDCALLMACEHITRLIEAGDALYDLIAPATNTTDATQLEAWLAAVSAINERADR